MRYRIFFLSMILSILTIPLFAQNIELLSSTLHSGGFTAVIISGDYAFCSVSRTLLTYSISDPANPVLVNANPGLGGDGAMLRGNLIYFNRVYYHNAQIQIVDISDPLSPVKITEFGYHTDDIAFDSNYIYMAKGNAGLHIYDNSDFQNPFFVSSMYTRQLAFGIAVADSYAYIADGDSGLTVVDIANPYSPNIVGFNNSSALGDHRFRDIAISGNYAYVADAYYGLRIFNIADPENPGYYSHLDLPINAPDIFIEGTLAYLEGEGAVYIVDIDDPAHPFVLGTYSGLGAPAAFFKADSILCVGGQSNSGSYDRYGVMQILDVSDPDNMIMLGSVSLPQHSSNCVVVDGTDAYAGDFRFYMVDYSNPVAPVPLGSYRTVWAEDVCFNGDYAYVISSSALKILSFADPAHPIMAGENPIASDSRAIYLEGNYAYIASTLGGLRIYDITDPIHAVLVGSYQGNEGDRDVVVRGNYAYLAEDYDGLRILDISDRANPILVGQMDTPNYMDKLCVSGDYAYAIVGGQMQVINISDPTGPNLITAFDPDYFLNEIFIQGNLAYVGSSTSLILAIVDISDPESPYELTSYDLPSFVNDIFVTGDLIYVAEFNSLLLLRYPVTAIAEDGEMASRNEYAIDCYPNPFNSRVVFTSTEPHNEPVDIFDITGRKIFTINMVNGSAAWNVGNYSSGVYFAKLQSPNYGFIKLLLLK